MRFKQILATAFRVLGGGGDSFEAAGHGRRLRHFQPSRAHVNAALERAGSTLVARARWLYQNDSYAGNAADGWVAAAVGEGVKPLPMIEDDERKKALLDLFWRWTEEADAEGLTDFYGLQARVVHETFIAGECFIRLRSRRPGDMATVPLQMQVLPSEMLDLGYSEDLGGDRFIRCGIEFDRLGRRVAYHFWRQHPNDISLARSGANERTRVPAQDVIHVFEPRQGSQMRGVTRMARVMVHLFMLNMYDDAELDRKKTAALFVAFVRKTGEAAPLQGDEDDEERELVPMEPGAMVPLGYDEDVTLSSPADVGGNYEAFQYRTLLKVASGLGVPYAVLTGDVTRGNFSNVRTAIVEFRRRVDQWREHVLVYQACRPIWNAWIDRVATGGQVDLPGYDSDPTVYQAAEWLGTRWDWVDPLKDQQAEVLAVRAGFKSRTQVLAERGYDRKTIDDEIEAENRDADRRGLVFVSDARNGGFSVGPASRGGRGGEDGGDAEDNEPENGAGERQ